MKLSQIRRSATCSFFLLWLCMTSTGWTATVTTNEAGMDTIFSQTNFGALTVDIRFNSTVRIEDHDLLTVTTAQEQSDLFALGPATGPTVNMYFIDTLDYCGTSFDVGIVGCADAIPGERVIVESAVAASGNGAELNAHELGHVFGLSHENPGLMNANSWGDTTLTVIQVGTILASDLIQIDSETNKRYVSITPILITPIPAALPLLLSAFGLLTIYNWRRHIT